MAEDGLLGFKFADFEDNLSRDTEILEATELLFVEAGFDFPGSELMEGEDEIRLRPAEFEEGLTEFSDGFEFGF